MLSQCVEQPGKAAKLSSSPLAEALVVAGKLPVEDVAAWGSRVAVLGSNWCVWLHRHELCYVMLFVCLALLGAGIAGHV